jgi:hypothetical protein
MSLFALPRRVHEPVDRRVLGAFRFEDAITAMPINVPGAVRTLGATLVREVGDVPVPLLDGGVRIRRNQTGFHVLFRAPLFDDYSNAFLNPQPPVETQAGPLRLRLGIVDAGPNHLPRAFSIDRPASIDPGAANPVFEAVSVPLLRAPAAPVQDGWAVLRVRVTETGTDPLNPLPGVLIRVFRSPRAAGDRPIGMGMTDWRGPVRGEALVPVTGVPRFRPGTGESVIETLFPVVLEMARAVAFTGAANQLPDPGGILAAIPPELEADAGSDIRLVRAAEAVHVRAGREMTLEMSMP